MKLGNIFRKIILPLLIVLLFGNQLIYGQGEIKGQEVSNIELFSIKSGVLIQKEYKNIGDFKNCKVEVLKVKNIIDGSQINGVRLSLIVSNNYSSSEKAALLDKDEVVALLKSIDLIIYQIIKSVKEDYTEVVYKSRGGFSAGCYWSEGKWTGFLKLKDYDCDSSIYFNANLFAGLKPILKEALTQMD